jgi:hypothetical protein
MNKYSVTYIGIIVAALGWIAEKAGLPSDSFTSIQVEGLINSIGFVMQVVGAVVAFYGRYRQGDINLLGRRKMPNITIDHFPPQ